MADTTFSSKQEFKLRSFEGPLDLLLFLIKKSEINIYDIPIAAITEQYLEYLKFTTKIDLNNITDFYVMASTLLYIKSRMLLPIDIDMDEEVEDPRKDLIDRLIEHQKYKKLSKLVEEQEKSGEWIIKREKQQKILPFQDEEIWEQISVWDLLTTFSSIIGSISTEKIIDLYEEITINEKITLINEYLGSKGEFRFTDLMIRENSIMEAICSFLAILELVKSRQIIVLQNKLFGDILIKERGEGKNGY